MNTNHFNSQFFQNRSCEYFPCHKNIKEEDFNCLFCYCPLYALGNDCGGNCKTLSNGVKDCSKCTFPHQKSNYYKVVEKTTELVNKVTENNLNSVELS